MIFSNVCVDDKSECVVCFVGCLGLLVIFCIVSSGVDDDGGVCEVVFSDEVECSLKRECLVESDVVLYLWFVVFFVYFVYCALYVCSLGVFVVAVVNESESGKNVVVVVDVGWMSGRWRDWGMASDRR